MIVPPGKLNGYLPGPYYTGGSDVILPQMDMAAMMRNSEMAAGFAREQSSLAHAQALEMEATRNAYASAISEREQQNETQLEAQQHHMESLLSDINTDINDEEESEITSVQFFNSLLGAMQTGPNTPSGSTSTPGTAEKGQTIYGSSARPM